MSESKVVMAEIVMATVAGKSKSGYDNVKYYAKSPDVEGLIKITDTLGTGKEYGGHDSYREFVCDTLGLKVNAKTEAIAEAAVGAKIIAIREEFSTIDENTKEKRTGDSWSVDAWL